MADVAVVPKFNTTEAWSLAKQRFEFSSYFGCVFCEFGGYVVPSVKVSNETTRRHRRQ